jgi:hypothetical protein
MPGPEDVLREFIMAMNAWELKYYPLMTGADAESHKPAMKAELDAIFEQFCTLKDRKYGRQTALSASYPPEYDADQQILDVQIDKNKALINTLQYFGERSAKMQNQVRYTLVLRKGEWRIDKNERFSTYDDKWEKSIL